MEYKTQMEAAKKGILTNEMKIVLKSEKIPENILLDSIAKGEIIIPANKNHKLLIPKGIGKGLKTKVNVNLGISKDCSNIELEENKVLEAINLKADAIMDLSIHENTQKFRKWLINNSSVMIGTVPVYDLFNIRGSTNIKRLCANDFINIIKQHAEDGVDFMTIHAGINKNAIKRFKNTGRLTNIVSRGGALMFKWMMLTGNENPYYEFYDEILKILNEYDITISLGDALRPGSIADATDASQIDELITLGELTKRAWNENVAVMVEGPGHMAINEIEANVILQKKLCHGAPFYVLGPLVTDVAPGYDHITSAIGGAIAASKGADFLCYVTPAEHLRLPDLSDMREGIIAVRIAAHAADIAKGVAGAVDWDNKMSTARVNLDWNEMFRLSINPEKAISYRNSSMTENQSTCSMCGEFCSIKNTNEILKG